MTAALPPIPLALPDEAATLDLGARLGRAARAGDVLALGGTLGLGKTALARALIRARLGPTVEVPSPSFTLVQIYDDEDCPIWHVDLYRLGGPDEVAELGLEEALGAGILLIEWPDRMGPALPDRRLDLVLSPGPGAESRVALLTAAGGSDWLARAGFTP